MPPMWFSSVSIELEEQLSVYRPHSEVSQLNHNAWQQPVSVEPELFELLALASRLSQETEGAFDITAGALIGRGASFGGLVASGT